MTFIWRLVGLLAAVSMAGFGCTGSDDDGDGLNEWLGADPHVRVVGTLNGETFDVDVSPASADDIWCVREWEIPLVDGELDYANGRMVEIKIEGMFDFDGERRSAELELKRHDFQSDSSGAVISVVPRSDIEDPQPSECWVEWEWHDVEDDETTFEQAAQDGSITLEELTGETDETGLLIPEGEGRVGFFGSVRFSQTEELTVSLSLPCTRNSIEEIE